ncbi:DUF7873 family protein [Streptomyces malaysiensis]|uniref:DUF7873 family protein n=1 Tax=Streptomyces malaysiensis TaxID=92644 RepID=UPI0040387111
MPRELRTLPELRTPREPVTTATGGGPAAHLDAAESWSLDPSADCWKTGAVRTVRTKKVLSLWVGSNACGRVPVPVGSSVREGE